MKNAAKIITGLALLLLLYFGSYWVLMRKGYLNSITRRAPAWFYSTGIESKIEQFFKPAEELHMRLFFHPMVKRAMTGRSQGVDFKDYVDLSPTGACEFQLGPYHQKGIAEYHQENAGFSMSFEHEEKRHQLTLMMDINSDGTGTRQIIALITLYTGSNSVPILSKTILTKVPESP